MVDPRFRRLHPLGGGQRPPEKLVADLKWKPLSQVEEQMDPEILLSTLQGDPHVNYTDGTANLRAFLGHC
ncbi:hypothetical protein Mapa_015061 [Marchantia paleacea]|nr:hypothetical protein Mapa_015061 [Marchantia paleacea]